MSYEMKLKYYDELIKESGLTRKGKTMPYTSLNGHMFTLLNKDGEIGIRFSKDTQKRYFEQYSTSHFISYGAKMQGYILVTPKMLEDKSLLIDLIKESTKYINTLQPK